LGLAQSRQRWNQLPRPQRRPATDDLKAYTSGLKLLALYQGTTLVVPKRSDTKLGFSPCVSL
jgi:hypothetical protein